MGVGSVLSISMAACKPPARRSNFFGHSRPPGFWKKVRYFRNPGYGPDRAFVGAGVGDVIACKRLLSEVPKILYVNIQ
jgi:hypothetical protein